MGIRELFNKEISAHPQEAHSHFTIVDPDSWSIFPSGTCDAAKMQKSGWEGPFPYVVDEVQYEAFGKRACYIDSMKIFLDDLGIRDGSNVTITCPGCGEILELPVSNEEQHFQCSICNKKFSVKNKTAVLIQDANKKPARAKLIDDTASAPRRQATYFQLEKIRESKDLFKYWRLFSLAPMSIKIASIFVVIQVLLDVLLREDLSGRSQTYTYGFAVVTLWMLSGVLKGYNWSRWTLVGVRGLGFVAAPFLYLGFIKSNSVWEIGLYADTMVSCGATFLTSIPYLIAIVLPSSNKWFNGYVADMNKLCKAVDDDMKPMSFGKQMLTVLVIAVILGGLAIGKVLLSDVAQKLAGNETQIKDESAILESISSEYQKRVNANRFGEVLNDADLLFARKKVEDTEWRIRDAKEFLNASIIKVKIELSKDRDLENKSRQYRDFDEARKTTLNFLKDYYQVQLDMVEQAAKIFYSSRMNSRDCPEDEQKKLQKLYGRYKHYSSSRVELQRLVDLNNKMIEMAKDFQAKADAISDNP